MRKTNIYCIYLFCLKLISNKQQINAIKTIRNALLTLNCSELQLTIYNVAFVRKSLIIIEFIVCNTNKHPYFNFTILRILNKLHYCFLDKEAFGASKLQASLRACFFSFLTLFFFDME